MRWWQGILLYITMLYIGGPLFIIFPMPGGIYNDIIIRLVTLVIAAIFLLPNPYACRTLFRLRRPLLGWTLAIAAGLTMVSQVTILVAFWTEPDMSGIVHPGAAWAQFLSIVILAPLSEELVLRGGIVTGLCEILPWQVTVALSGLLFARGHKQLQSSANAVCWGDFGVSMLVYRFDPVRGAHPHVYQCVSGVPIHVCAVGIQCRAGFRGLPSAHSRRGGADLVGRAWLYTPRGPIDRLTACAF